MPLTVENSSGLLNEVVDMATQKTQRVRVVRAFLDKGTTRGVDGVYDFPSALAFELRSANKVEFVQSDTKLKESVKITPPVDARLPAKK